MDIQLNPMEKELFVLELVKACIKRAEDSERTFGEVLGEEVFADKASAKFEKMVCSTMESLHEKGVITGIVEIGYIKEFDFEDDSERDTDEIDISICTFEDIAISTEAGEDVAKKGFKEAGKDFWVKVKPVIGCIGQTILQTAVEASIKAGLNAVGITV